MSTVFGRMSANQVRAVHGFYHVCGQVVEKGSFIVQGANNNKIVAGDEWLVQMYRTVNETDRGHSSVGIRPSHE